MLPRGSQTSSQRRRLLQERCCTPGRNGEKRRKPLSRGTWGTGAGFGAVGAGGVASDPADYRQTADIAGESKEATENVSAGTKNVYRDSLYWSGTERSCPYGITKLLFLKWSGSFLPTLFDGFLIFILLIGGVCLALYSLVLSSFGSAIQILESRLGGCHAISKLVIFAEATASSGKNAIELFCKEFCDLEKRSLGRKRSDEALMSSSPSRVVPSSLNLGFVMPLNFVIKKQGLVTKRRSDEALWSSSSSRLNPSSQNLSSACILHRSVIQSSHIADH